MLSKLDTSSRATSYDTLSTVKELLRGTRRSRGPGGSYLFRLLGQIEDSFVHVNPKHEDAPELTLSFSGQIELDDILRLKDFFEMEELTLWAVRGRRGQHFVTLSGYVDGTSGMWSVKELQRAQTK